MQSQIRHIAAQKYSLAASVIQDFKVSNTAVKTFRLPDGFLGAGGHAAGNAGAHPNFDAELDQVLRNSMPTLPHHCGTPFSSSCLQDVPRVSSGSSDGEIRDALYSVQWFEKHIFRAVLAENFAILNPSEGAVLQMFQLVREYLEISLALRAHATALSHPAQQQSREVLVCYSVFCFVFEACKRLWPSLIGDRSQGFGVGVTTDKLAMLLLPSASLQSAALKIHKYLEQNAPSAVVTSALFNLKHQKGTLRFARRCTDADRFLAQQFQREMENRHERKTGYDREQARRRAECARKEEQLKEETQNLERAERNRDRCRSGNEAWHRENNTVREFAVRADRLRNEIAELQQAPQCIVEPLPHLQTKMKEILFFLYTPSTLGVLAHLTSLCEAAFLPRDSKTTRSMPAMAAGPEVCSWESFYSSHQRYQYAPNVRASQPFPVANQPCGLFLGYLNKQDQEQPPKARDGSVQVYPNMGLHALWNVCAPQFPANPFVQLPTASWLCENVFSEQLVTAADRDSLGWSMGLQLCESGGLFCNTDRMLRENQAISTQDKCPDWLRTSQYVRFCTTRAHPCLQLRNVLAMLHDQSLPLTDPTVHQLVRQALYQFGPPLKLPAIGENRNNGDPSPLLTANDDNFVVVEHADATPPAPNDFYVRHVLLDCYNDQLRTFCEIREILDALVDTFREKPRDHLALGFLCEIAGAFVQWHSPLRNTLRAVARTTYDWAVQHMRGRNGDGDETENVLPTFFLRYCVSALLSLPALNADDLELYCAAQLRLRSLLAPNVQAVFSKEEDAKTRHCYEEVVGRNRLQVTDRIDEVVAGVEANLSVILNGALRSADSLPDLPQNLEWSAFRQGERGVREVFVARSERGLYSVNVATGALLVNGAPPGRLPHSVCDDPLFRKTFGDMDIGVHEHQRGYITTRKWGRAYFLFEKVAPQDLVPENDTRSPLCREQIFLSESEEHSLELQLVAPEVIANVFRARQAAHLASRYTHWYCHSLRALFFRSCAKPEDCEKRGTLFGEVHYVLKLFGDAELGVSWVDAGLPSVFTKESTQLLFEVPPAFRNAEKFFVSPLWSTAGAAACEAACEVGFESSLLTVLGIDSQIVFADADDVAANRILDVLAKFEARDYVQFRAALPSLSCEGFLHANLPDAQPFPVTELEFRRYDMVFRVAGRRLLSREHAGYVLCEEQVLPGNMWLGFDHYLTLQPLQVHAGTAGDPSANADLSQLVDSPLRALVTDGKLVDGRGIGRWRPQMSSRGVSSDADAEWVPRRVFQYDVPHAGTRMVARNNEARLQLAALCLVTSMPLVEHASGLRGAETAAELVRKSSLLVGRSEQQKFIELHSVLQTLLQRAAPSERQKLSALHCLVDLVAERSWRLAFCYYPTAFGATSALRTPADVLQQVRDYGAEVLRIKNLACASNHLLLNLSAGVLRSEADLSPAEEWKLFGLHSDRRARRGADCQPVVTVQCVGERPCRGEDFVCELERRVAALAVPRREPTKFRSEATMAKVDEFLTTLGQGFSDGGERVRSKVGEKYQTNLRDSWLEFKLPQEFELCSEGDFRNTIKDVFAQVEGNCCSCFNFVAEALDTWPDALAESATGVRATDRENSWLLRLAGVVHNSSCRRVAAASSAAAAFNETAPTQLAHARAQEQALHLLCEFLIWPERLRRANPFLADDAKTEVWEAIRRFLELRVLKDRLARIAALCGGEGGSTFLQNSVALLKEVQCRRVWNTREHPSWLVLEAWGRLQIRPNQYVIAKQLAGSSGAGVISQLNMGEGKTRVIMPMLALLWTVDAPSRYEIGSQKLVRVTVLSPLLAEMREVLQNILTVGPLDRQLFEIPFNRDVDLSQRGNVMKVLDTLRECRDARGVLLVTPEQRLSLQLKYVELARDPGLVNAEVLQRVRDVVNFPAIDLLDEADACLHYNWQLVYAVGMREELPHRNDRVATAMGLLRVLRESERVREKLWKYPEAVLCSVDGAPAHEFFSKIQLCETAADSARLREELAEVLAEEILTERFLPHEFSGLGTYLQAQQRQQQEGNTSAGSAPGAGPGVALRPTTSSRLVSDLKRIVLKKECDANRDHAFRDLPPKGKTFVLALRGLLAYDVLLHVLQKVWKKDYGPASGACSVEMCKPYQAADTPKDRAEFWHVDVGICASCLSSYYQGLSPAQLRRAIGALLVAGTNASESAYRSWFALSAPGMESDAHRRSLDSVSKLDLTNAPQFALLERYFARNYETINFFLKHCVFPNETRQYPENIAATPWNLAEGGRGFSGTKDTQFVYPCSVSQKWPQVPGGRHSEESMMCSVLSQVKGTDGEMLAVVACNPVYRSATEKLVRWRDVLRTALLVRADETGGAGGQGGVSTRSLADRSDASVAARTRPPAPTDSRFPYRALIDVGGFMAGATGREVAEYILELLQLGSDQRTDVRGVVYHDVELDCKVIMARNKVVTPRDRSPIQADECFAYYDEARTRGTDFRLPADALACVTLSPTVTKDAFMQACGRMRRLREGQQLHFFGSQEVTHCLRDVRKSFRDGGTTSSSEESEYGRDERGTGWETGLEEADSAAVGGSRASRADVGLQLTSTDVLLWVSVNTVQKLTLAIPQWAKQGSLYCAVQGDPRVATRKEAHDLDGMYAGALKPKRISRLATDVLERFHQCVERELRAAPRADGVTQEEVEQELRRRRDVMPFKQYREKIRQRAEDFGGQSRVFDSALDQELERELQKEIEQEYQRELPAPEEAAEEVAWRYELVFEGATGLERLLMPQSPSPWLPIVRVLRDTQALGAEENLLAFLEREDSLYATRNFRTVLKRQADQHLANAAGAGGGRMDNYLRPALRFLLYFHRAEVAVLLTDCEAHELWRCFYARPAQRAGLSVPDLERVGLPREIVDLVHANLHQPPAAEVGSASSFPVSLLDYSFLRDREMSAREIGVAPHDGQARGEGEQAEGRDDDSRRMRAPLALHSEALTEFCVSDRLMALLALVNGECMFRVPAQREEVRRLLGLDPSANSEQRELGIKFVKKMNALRGREAEFERSDLHKMLLEAGA
eukprot:g12274.t1